MEITSLPPVLLRGPSTYEDLCVVERVLGELLDPLVGVVVDVGGGYGAELWAWRADTDCPRRYDFQAVVLPRPWVAWCLRALHLPVRVARPGLPHREAANRILDDWRKGRGRNPAERYLTSLREARHCFVELSAGLYAYAEWAPDGSRDWHRLSGPCTPEFLSPMQLDGQSALDAMERLLFALRLLAVSRLPDVGWQAAVCVATDFPGTPEELVAAALAVTSAPAR